MAGNVARSNITLLLSGVVLVLIVALAGIEFASKGAAADMHKVSLCQVADHSAGVERPPTCAQFVF